MRRLSRFVSFGGVLLAGSAFSLLHANELAPEAYDPVGTFRFPWTVLFLLATLVATYSFGLPETAPDRKTVSIGALAAVGVGAGLVSVAALAIGTPLLPRFVLGSMFLTAAPIQLIAWNLAGDVERAEATRAKAILVAERETAAQLAADLQDRLERPVTVVARIDPADAIADEARGSHPLIDQAEQEQASLIVLDVAAQAEPSVVAQAANLHSQGIRIRTLSLFTEEYLGKLPVSELERVSLLFDIGEVHRIRYNRVKRVFDIVLSGIGMIAFLPVMGAVVVGNRVANRGPLFYRQERVGKNGEVFTILKFRSMVPDDGPSNWTTENDVRITPFGSMLRRSHLDELPQLINILRGDLSLVGPRPEQPRYVEELRQKLPFYDVRHLVRPGLTGWAQVKYPYGADEQDALEKLQYEFFYLRRQSLTLDARIVVRTHRRVAGARGR